MLGELLIAGSIAALCVHVAVFVIRDGPVLVLPRLTSVGLFIGMPAFLGAGFIWSNVTAQVIGSVIAIACLVALVSSNNPRRTDAPSNTKLRD